MNSVQWIDTQSALNQLCHRRADDALITLDTEFIRRKTFFAELGLIQLGFEAEIALVDPLAKLDWTPLKQLLSNTASLKILHAVGEDLEVLNDFLGIVPAPVFDTQIYAGFAALGASLSLQNLVAQLLNKTISKEQTQSDWLARPLSQAQCEYAAEDVRVLMPIHQFLLEKLDSQKRSWAAADCQRLVQKALSPALDQQPHWRNPGAERLSEAEQRRFWALLRWRDQTARKKDLPRNWLIQIPEAFTVAKMPMQSKSIWEASLAAQLPNRRRSAAEWFELLRQAESSTEFKAFPKPITAHREKIKVWKETAEAQAQVHGLPADLIAPKRILEAFLETEPKDWDEATRWRASLLIK